MAAKTSNASDEQGRSKKDSFKHHLKESKTGILIILVSLILFIGGGALGYSYADENKTSLPAPSSVSQSAAVPQTAEADTARPEAPSSWVSADDLRNDCLNSSTAISLSTPRELNQCLFDGILSKCESALVSWNCYDAIADLMSNMADRISFSG